MFNWQLLTHFPTSNLSKDKIQRFFNAISLLLTEAENYTENNVQFFIFGNYVRSYHETPSIGSDLSSLFNGWLPFCWISKQSCFVYPTNQSKVIKIKDKNPLETLEKTSCISCKGSVCKTSSQLRLFLFSDFLKCHGSVVHSLVLSDLGHICGSDILHIISTCFPMQVEQSEHVIRM